MSQRDLAHLMTALRGTAEGEGVPTAALDRALGRTAGDLRTVLNLQSLEADGLVRETGPGVWALSEAGVQRLRDDDALSNR